MGWDPNCTSDLLGDILVCERAARGVPSKGNQHPEQHVGLRVYPKPTFFEVDQEVTI